MSVGRCRCSKAIASVSASCTTPSSMIGGKGRPLFELMIWMTPIRSRVFSVDYRCHEHLPRPVAGLHVHRLEEVKLRLVRLELRLVIDVADVHHALVARHVSGDRLVVHRELDVLEGMKTRLDLRYDRGLVFARDVDREPVCAEKIAQLLRELDHDLVDVGRRVYLVRERLQLLLEREFLGEGLLADGSALKHSTHDRLASRRFSVRCPRHERNRVKDRISGCSAASAAAARSPWRRFPP